MAVTMEQIKELRERTGVSISACKKALDEADGDMDKAIEIMRKTGAAKAADKASRGTAHSLVVSKSDGKKAGIIELRCETDFVAKDESFIEMAGGLVDKLLASEISAEDRDLPEIKEAVMRLGENIQIANMAVVEGENLGEYIHNGKIGVVVALKGGNVDLAKDIAMHVAATNPQVVSPDEISDDLVSKEKEIWIEQLKSAGKPENIIENILRGKEKKFREENALVKQAFVKNPEKTIENLLTEAEAMIENFVRFGV